MVFSVRKLFSAFIADTFLTYTTVKVVKVPNTFIGIIFRILQLIIFAYIVCYIVWFKKGYQEFQEPHGTSVIKVKGIAKVTTKAGLEFKTPPATSLWDTPEYQLPPLENSAFFIATRQIVTHNQTERTCASFPESTAICNQSDPNACPKGQDSWNTFGFNTGKCIPSVNDDTHYVCEIEAWCPEELTASTEYVMNPTDLEDFTVFLKTLVTFSTFNINLRNIRDETNFSCRYHKETAPRCPIFRIGDILDSLETNRTALHSDGGLIEIRQKWDCNFDFKPSKCYPTHAFNILQSGDDKSSPGINYRAASKTRIDGIDYRILSKIYGLRFVVTITGTGGRFYIVNLFVAIGSGIGFMVLAGIICDFIFEYIHKAKKHYRESKFAICEIDQKPSRSSDNSIDVQKNVDGKKEDLSTLSYRNGSFHEAF